MKLINFETFFKYKWIMLTSPGKCHISSLQICPPSFFLSCFCFTFFRCLCNVWESTYDVRKALDSCFCSVTVWASDCFLGYRRYFTSLRLAKFGNVDELHRAKIFLCVWVKNHTMSFFGKQAFQLLVFGIGVSPPLPGFLPLLPYFMI